ncbi:MAG TPA: M1 family metallopeptidase [Gemmatimonadaceae bacterium]|nr:M1 family metallopeptidase [Gemmatimonadaceae bacterium]
MRCRRLLDALAISATLFAAACVTTPPARPSLGIAIARDSATPFTRAVARGTRSWTGAPGPRYWQQTARYRLEATLDPSHARLTGRGTVWYVNRSPDTLRALVLELYQNIHALDTPKNEPMPLTGGIRLARVAAQGVELHELPPSDTAADPPGYVVDGTVGRIALPRPLLPGDSAELRFEWSFRIPAKGSPRMGQDGVVFFLGYWYPQVAVYDDVDGWHTDPYVGTGEFYMDYADYDVAITAPDGWLVAATGELDDPDSVLSPAVRARLADARRTGAIVHVVSSGERRAGRSTVRGEHHRITWRFRARGVRDFAFAASRGYVWDATTASVGDRDGDGRPDTVMIHSLYRPGTWGWKRSASYVKQSIEFLSTLLWPYPYPHMTAAEGLVSGGMEYPMITLVGGRLSPRVLYDVTVHEVGHMWFPMQVGSDETRFGWQDEGLASYDEALAVRAYLGTDEEREQQSEYLRSAGHAREEPLLRHADAYLSRDAYTTASYDKPATVLRALRGVLGDSLFLRAYREYGRRWSGRHPRPEDFFHTFEDISGRDLSWFWNEWFLQTWTLDQAISSIRDVGDSTEIVIENRGRAVMPVLLAIARPGSAVEHVTLPVDVWLHGATRHALLVRHLERGTRVTIDPDRLFPDVNRGNGRARR